MPEPTTLQELAIPTTLDGPGGAAFSTIRGLFRQAGIEELGHDDLVTGDSVEIARIQPSAYGRHLIQVARRGQGPEAEIIGAAVVFLPSAENRQSADVDLVVATRWRRQGVGSRLLRRVADRCLERGRTVLNLYTGVSLDHGGEEAADRPVEGVLRPDSGAGWISLDAPGPAFAHRHGFTLGLVDRGSRAGIGIDDDAALASLEERASASGTGYVLESWTGPVPDDDVADYCRIIERMDTDPPAGGLSFEPSRWDGPRLRTMEARRRNQGTTSVVTVARELASGHLVAYTELVVFNGQEHLAFQEGTLVLPEHRGHRLGLRIKASNHRRLLQALPRVDRIYTWNAAENSYMLRVNEALGFSPSMMEGE
ncbi:MAG: GNAT family N-acetyltransferase, partial [Micrococcaceae bacterium]|nr:GNAT family N-acetyltransferase [Micrococcaceae bacterium]